MPQKPDVHFAFFSLRSFLSLAFLLAVILVGFTYLKRPIAAQETTVTSSNNPIIWKTKYAKISANNFYIRIGDTYYYGADNVRVHSDPGSDTYTTLEVTWQENGREMRLNLYFAMDSNKMWRVTEVRSYNGAQSGDWIYYNDPQGSTSSKGAYAHDVVRRFTAKNGVDAEIYCGECSVQAFMDRPLEYSSQGYGLELMSGVSDTETITLSTDPMSGYGVNVLLRNTQKEVVTDQKDFTYEWTVANSNIARVYPNKIEYADGGCAYGIKAPCPLMNGQIQGVAPGITKVQVSVKKDNYVVATREIEVKVVRHTSVPNPSSSPTPGSSPSPSPALSSPLPVDDDSLDDEELRQELENLKGTVGAIQLDVANQRQELNALQRVVNSINRFFRNLFGRG